MKKAKLLLGAIAVLAIAGGVYASKAHRIDTVAYYKTLTTTTARCSLTYFATSISTVALGQLPTTTTYATDVYNALCPVKIPLYTAP